MNLCKDLLGRSPAMKALEDSSVFLLWRTSSFAERSPVQTQTQPRIAADEECIDGRTVAIYFSAFSKQSGTVKDPRIRPPLPRLFPFLSWYFACCMNEDCTLLEIFYNLLLSVIKKKYNH